MPEETDTFVNTFQTNTKNWLSILKCWFHWNWNLGPKSAKNRNKTGYTLAEDNKSVDISLTDTYRNVSSGFHKTKITADRKMGKMFFQKDKYKKVYNYILVYQYLQTNLSIENRRKMAFVIRQITPD